MPRMCPAAILTRGWSVVARMIAANKARASDARASEDNSRRAPIPVATASVTIQRLKEKVRHPLRRWSFSLTRLT